MDRRGTARRSLHAIARSPWRTVAPPLMRCEQVCQEKVQNNSTVDLKIFFSCPVPIRGASAPLPTPFRDELSPKPGGLTFPRKNAKKNVLFMCQIDNVLIVLYVRSRFGREVVGGVKRGTYEYSVRKDLCQRCLCLCDDGRKNRRTTVIRSRR